MNDIQMISDINRAHEACISSANESLNHAMRCGDLLASAKAGCSHGTWREWLQENFTGSARTARAYMRLAKNRNLIESKRQAGAILGVAEATRMIASSNRRPTKMSQEQADRVLLAQVRDYLDSDECTLEGISAFIGKLQEVEWKSVERIAEAERELVCLLNELDKEHYTGFGYELLAELSTDEGYDAFLRACDERLAELEGAT